MATLARTSAGFCVSFYLLIFWERTLKQPQKESSSRSSISCQCFPVHYKCQMASLPIFLRFYNIYLYCGDSIWIMQSRDRQYVKLHFKSIVTYLHVHHGPRSRTSLSPLQTKFLNELKPLKKFNEHFVIFRLKFQPRLQEAIKLLFCLQLRHI